MYISLGIIRYQLAAICVVNRKSKQIKRIFHLHFANASHLMDVNLVRWISMDNQRTKTLTGWSINVKPMVNIDITKIYSYTTKVGALYGSVLLLFHMVWWLFPLVWISTGLYSLYQLSYVLSSLRSFCQSHGRRVQHQASFQVKHFNGFDVIHFAFFEFIFTIS